MKQLKQAINKVVEWTSIGLVVVMVLLVLWQVVARYLLNNPSSFSEALTRYLFVWLVLITSTYAFGSRDHMYIAALNDKLKGKTKTVVNILIEALTILFAGCVMVYGGSIITRMQMVSLDSSLHIPMGVVYCWVSVKQFSKNDTATACQDWLRSTRLGRGSIKSHVRTVKVLGMGLFAFQERIHLWKGVTH